MTDQSHSTADVNLVARNGMSSWCKKPPGLNETSRWPTMPLQHSLLLHYLPLYFPEFGRYWYSTRNEWFIRFLIRFPVRAMDQTAFIAEAWNIVGKKVNTRAKVEAIYELAAHSIGLPVALDSPAVEPFRLQLERYAELIERRT